MIMHYDLYISVLTIHISSYITKRKVPDENMKLLLESFEVVPVTERITYKALEGPTSDFEDNVQLHSAAEADAEVFLTEDKELLKLKFFGKTEIRSA
jgi:predicted nucleic acid-binding protein